MSSSSNSIIMVWKKCCSLQRHHRIFHHHNQHQHHQQQQRQKQQSQNIRTIYNNNDNSNIGINHHHHHHRLYSSLSSSSCVSSSSLTLSSTSSSMSLSLSSNSNNQRYRYRYRWIPNYVNNINDYLYRTFASSSSSSSFEVSHDDNNTNTTNFHQSTPQPWKGLLETMGRAAWRVTDPEQISTTSNSSNSSLLQSCRTILQNGNRTPKQLLRSHRKVVAVHSELSNFRERERRRIVNGKRIHNHRIAKTTKKGNSNNNVDDIDDDMNFDIDNNNNNNNNSNNITVDNNNNNKTIHPVYYGYEETLANLRYRTIPNYAICKRVLEETKSLLGNENFQPKRIIDFGIGCGSASAAAIDVFHNNNNNKNNNKSGGGMNDDYEKRIEWIHGIDPSQPMRDCSKMLLEGMTTTTANTSGTTGSAKMPPRITFSTTLSTDSGSNTATSTSTTSTGRNFDLALFCYTATELPDIMSTLAAAAILFEKLKPNGVMIMIEPGTPDGFNSIRSVRNMLLDCCPPPPPSPSSLKKSSNQYDEDDDEYDDDELKEWPERCHIIAPCTHNGSCPMERHKKTFIPKGKLGHDLPQEEQDEQIATITGNEEDDDEDYDYDNDDNNHDSDDEVDDDDDDDDEDDDDYDDFIDMSSSSNNNLMSETNAFHSSFCSFVHTIPSSSGNSSNDSNKRGEKFSYLVVQKRLLGTPEDTPSFLKKNDKNNDNDFDYDCNNVTTLLARARDAALREDSDDALKIFRQAQALESKYFDLDKNNNNNNDEDDEDDLGLELLRGDSRRQSMGRIIRAPIKKKGHVYIDYCTSPGRIIRSRITKATSNNVSPGLYTAARKSRWGGYWPDTMDKIPLYYSEMTKKETTTKTTTTTTTTTNTKK